MVKGLLMVVQGVFHLHMVDNADVVSHYKLENEAMFLTIHLKDNFFGAWQCIF